MARGDWPTTPMTPWRCWTRWASRKPMSSGIPWAAARYGGCSAMRRSACSAPASSRRYRPTDLAAQRTPTAALCAEDAAGSGGGVANPQYTQLLRDGERGDGEMTPRHVMNNFYWKPGYISPREEDLLSSVLATHTGERDYPGDSVASANWPGVAPGRWGVMNAMAPNNQPDPARLANLAQKPPVLWLRGDSDQVIADMSFFDLATFGKLGVVPGWPGDEVCPPQPMIAQTKAVLDAYAAAGGSVEEVVLEDCGHTPFVEKAAEFNAALHGFLSGV